MFERKRCHHGLLPVALALAVAMTVAFGLVSMRATADPATDLDKKQVAVTVTDVEKGVTGTAYKYMDVNWRADAGQPGTPEYIFKDEVATWMRGGF